MSRSVLPFAHVGQASLLSAALRLDAAQRAQPLLSSQLPFDPARSRSTQAPTRTLPPPPMPRFTGDAIVIAPNGVDVYQYVPHEADPQRLTSRFVGHLPRFTTVFIDQHYGPLVILHWGALGTRGGEGHASFVDPSTRRVNFQKIASGTDRVGQNSLVNAALQLEAARRAQAAQVLQRTPLPPFDPARARTPGTSTTTSIPDPNAPRRPRLTPIEAARRLTQALDRFGIPYGRVQVTHPRGVQIWTAPQGEYRPGTGIPLMDRLVVLPQGTILTVTPDPRMIEAAINSPEGFGMGFYSFEARWNLGIDQPFSVGTFERRGVPTSLLRGQGYIAGTMADRLRPLRPRGQTVPT